MITALAIPGRLPQGGNVEPRPTRPVGRTNAQLLRRRAHPTRRPPNGLRIAQAHLLAVRTHVTASREVVGVSGGIDEYVLIVGRRDDGRRRCGAERRVEQRRQARTRQRDTLSGDRLRLRQGADATDLSSSARNRSIGAPVPPRCPLPLRGGTARCDHAAPAPGAFASPRCRPSILAVRQAPAVHVENDRF